MWANSVGGQNPKRPLSTILNCVFYWFGQTCLPIYYCRGFVGWEIHIWHHFYDIFMFWRSNPNLFCHMVRDHLLQQLLFPMPVEAWRVVAATDHMQWYDDFGYVLCKHGTAVDVVIFTFHHQIATNLKRDICCLDIHILYTSVSSLSRTTRSETLSILSLT